MYATEMEKKSPFDDKKNRFEEVIRKSQERRNELNNKVKKKPLDDLELPPRDEETIEPDEEGPAV
ncbi:MAG: hypothetical protein WA738_03135 [Candidatus Angelobacter sp.]